MNAAFFSIWILAAVEHGRTSNGLTASFKIVEKVRLHFLLYPVFGSQQLTQKSTYVRLDFISPEEKMQNTYALYGYKFL